MKNFMYFCVALTLIVVVGGALAGLRVIETCEVYSNGEVCSYWLGYKKAKEGNR